LENQLQRRKGFAHDILKNRFSYLLALPAMVYTFLFGYMTYPYIVIAFQRFNYTKGIFDSEWIGFKNFEFFYCSSSRRSREIKQILHLLLPGVGIGSYEGSTT
jgi:putative aldouronate transport system permease protein